MDTRSQSIEAIRARYRPERIVTLFVGESAPASGKFFYGGETALARHIRQAMQAAKLAPDAIGHREFLDRFKSCGWYLDDLALTPIDQWGRPERAAARARHGRGLSQMMSNMRLLPLKEPLPATLCCSYRFSFGP